MSSDPSWTEDSPADSDSWADTVVDELLPGELDWRSKVRAYPKASVIVAAGIGFLLGRARGSLLFTSITSFATDEVTRNITGALNRRRSTSD